MIHEKITPLNMFCKATICILLLIAFTVGMPIGYYELIKLVLPGLFGVLAYQSYKDNRNIPAIIFTCIALIFNPIIPLHFKKMEWLQIDFLVFIMTIIWLIRDLIIRFRTKVPSR